MFFLCENIIKIKKINRILESGIFVFAVTDASDDITVYLKKFTTKTVNDENNDETEEYLKIRDVTIQVNINKKQSWKDKAVIIPK
tara:strand:- start:526 stop:780 length:255 start_codon:yes stop_codon:yes gene_type:complete